MKRQIITIILTFVAISAMGQGSGVVLQGSIQDSFLERGLFDCTVTLMRADSTAVECQPKVYELGNDEMHISTVFYIDVPRQAANYIIRVQKDGYEDGWAKVSVPDGYKEKMLMVPMVNMKKSIMKTVGLNEVVVKATRIKVKMRGDTLVYDASALAITPTEYSSFRFTSITYSGFSSFSPLMAACSDCRSNTFSSFTVK